MKRREGKGPERPYLVVEHVVEETGDRVSLLLVAFCEAWWWVHLGTIIVLIAVICFEQTIEVSQTLDMGAINSIEDAFEIDPSAHLLQ